MPTVRLERKVRSMRHITSFTPSTIGVSKLTHAVEDRLAVFMLADLQEGRVRRRLDEIAGGIDLEQPRRPALDLPAQHDRDVEADILRLAAPRRPPGTRRRTAWPTSCAAWNMLRTVRSVCRAPSRLDAFLQPVPDRLGDRRGCRPRAWSAPARPAPPRPASSRRRRCCRRPHWSGCRTAGRSPPAGRVRRNRSCRALPLDPPGDIGHFPAGFLSDVSFHPARDSWPIGLHPRRAAARSAAVITETTRNARRQPARPAPPASPCCATCWTTRPPAASS